KGDPTYYALSEALQHLGNVAFRSPVPAYKHSAAIFLNITGKVPSDRTTDKIRRDHPGKLISCATAHTT
ncbi:MAG TPA: hypothetical protein VE135_16400, partial [Pyrinomonadaceae bacterium]|nr:hypothetical protein [Pyrinomonadaceae bacterium]